MNTKSISLQYKSISIIWAVVFFIATPSTFATTHIIQFGGTFGFTYSPNSLNVSVGDTIQWEGDFGFHPLSSTNVPSGALSFHQGSGSVFSYPVMVAGEYLYQCDNHFSSGMKGSFNATITDIRNIGSFLQLSNFKLEQNFPNPFNPATKISFSIPQSNLVTLKVYDILGNDITTLVNERKTAGNYSVNFNASNLPSGVYFYRIQAGNFVSTKKFVLLK